MPFFPLFLVGSLCMEIYLPLIQSFECLLITSVKGFRMGIHLHKGFLINIVYCIPVSIFTKYVLFFVISLNSVMIRVNSYQIPLNKNIEKKKHNLIFRSQAGRIPSQLFSPPAKHLDFQLAPKKNG